MSDFAALVDWKWSYVRGFLPLDLDGLAVETGVLQRRRGVRGGEALVRALLLCALPKTTLIRASAMARHAGIADLNSVALFKRLRSSEPLLRALLGHTLGFASAPVETWGGYRLVAADATSLSGPGSRGTDQRLHVLYDLARCSPVQIELTDAKGGETLDRYDLGEGDLVVADRGYAYPRSLMAVFEKKASMLVRIDFATLRLLDDRGEKIWHEQALGALGQSPWTEFCAYLPNYPKPLRVIGGQGADGQGVWLLTDLPASQLPAHAARDLYSKRWQIELFFKRLKSIVDLDELPTREGPTARAWIWAKLLLASLAVLIAHERFSPWGAPTIPSPNQPLANDRARTYSLGSSAARPSRTGQKRQAEKGQKAACDITPPTNLVEA